MDKKDDKRSTHDLKKRFLECPICLEEFDESSKLPKVLPCLHTFCCACLQKLRKDSTLTCSLCSKSYDTPGSNFDLFPTDLTRRDLLDFVHAGIEPEKLTCENCYESLPAKYRCKDCPSYLCEGCNTTHNKVRKFESHSIFCLDNVNENAASKIQDFAKQDTCDIVVHEQEKLEYYCKLQGCVKSICIKCFVSAHKDHEVPIIRDVYEEKKQYLQEKGQGLVRRVDETNAVIEHVEKTLVDLQLKRENTQAKITASIDISLSHLHKRKEDLLSQNTTIYEQKSETLELQLHELRAFKESLVPSRKFLDNSLSYRNEPAFMRISKTIDDRFDNLLDHRIDQLPHEKQDLEFKPINMGSSFAISTHGFGVVLSEKVDPKYTEISIPNVLLVNQQHVIDIQVRNSRGHKLSVANLVDLGLHISYNEDETQLIECDVLTDGTLQAKWIPIKRRAYDLRLVNKEEELGKVECNVITAAESDSTGAVLDVFASEVNSKSEVEEVIVASREGNVTISSESDSTGAVLDVFASEVNSKSEVEEVIVASREGNVTISCPDFQMDETTLFSKRFLSEDKKTLFNTRCSANEQHLGEPRAVCSYDWPTGSYKNYRGTRGSLLIKPPDQVNYEVRVTYNIIKDLQKNWLVFGTGIAREESIDLNHCIDGNQHGWSVHAARDTTTEQLALRCENNGKILYSETLSECTAGTSKTLTLGIYVNTQNNLMSVVDVDRDALVYTFSDIDFTQPLRPVFGVYNPSKVHVTMKLKTGIKGLPKCLQ